MAKPFPSPRHCSNPSLPFQPPPPPPGSPPAASAIANLILTTSDPRILSETLLEYHRSELLVNSTLKRLWNHAPKALEFFNILDHHCHYSHSLSSFDLAIDLATHLRDFNGLWFFVDRLQSSRLGPTPKTFAIIIESFLSLYNRDGVESIGLDDAANKLGVERRRIYDIVNVLESVGVLSRRAKNQYTWKGFKAIPQALAALRDEGLREKFGSSEGGSKEKVKVLDYDEDTCSNPDIGSQSEPSNPSVIKSSASSKSDNRREKSLGLLTQNFVKLFICSSVDLISLDEAAKVLLGDGHNTLVMRTKVRRLYDIANVLSSMRLIEKTHQVETRKPAFRWLGLRERTEDTMACPPISTETKKRTFGTEITNISFKKNKVDSVGGEDAKLIKQQVKIENVDSDCNHLEQDKRPVSRNYQYGPFAPVTVAKVGVAEQKNTKPVHDLESLASTYRPQYHNQALRDLFDHYVEAWKSWYSEIAGKPPLQQVS